MATILSLMPAEVDLTVEQETDVTLEFVLKRYEDGVWIAEDLTADSVKFTSREDYGSANTTIATKTNTTGQHYDAANGKTRFKLTKTDLDANSRTADVTWKYEVRRVVGGTSDEIVYIRGKLKLAKTVGLG